MVPADALARADGDPFLGTTVAGRFVVVGKLGAGSMGTVYRARQEAVGRDVAIKILRADRAFDAVSKARFSREARAMSLLSSPHTVTVFDFGEIPDPRPDELTSPEASLYLAMELLEGEALGARLKRRGRLPVEESVRIARQALLSLAEAHDKGIIHRDLKPDNIFLARVPTASFGEMVKVLDFGIAKVRALPSVDALETQAGTVFGTPRYMSPEQAQGRELDARSDLYTLGVLLYQMLVGRPPFTDDDAVVVMARHIKTTPVAPADAAPDAGIGAALSALVMRALAKDPDDRPPSAQTFIAMLDDAFRASASVRPRGVPAATASGEMAAVVHDGLGAGPATARAPFRLSPSRAGLVLATSAAVVVSAGLFALSALRPARLPSARNEIGHLVTTRRLALLEAQASSTAATSTPAPPTSDTAPPSTASPGSTLRKPTTGSTAASHADDGTPSRGAPPPAKPRRYKIFER
jgi:serine/threonine-protein kinase